MSLILPSCHSTILFLLYTFYPTFLLYAINYLMPVLRLLLYTLFSNLLWILLSLLRLHILYCFLSDVLYIFVFLLLGSCFLSLRWILLDYLPIWLKYLLPLCFLFHLIYSARIYCFHFLLSRNPVLLFLLLNWNSPKKFTRS